MYAKRLENNLKKNRPQVAKVHKDAGDTLRLKKGDNWRDSGEGTKKGSTGGTEKSTNVPKVKPELFKNGRVTVESIKENR
ncbi:hypothetical protein, partial [Numidum massiliense]|uniref:hypothetical protein n=1 Tax=Numidum massiliense TaxID=1522315 RepID=UPI001C9C1457